MRILAILVCIGLVSGSLHGADTKKDDPAPVGSNYTGILKRFGLPNDRGSLIGTFSARLKVLERDGDKFEGELWLKGRDKTHGSKIAGTITSRGGVKFTMTERLTKGDGPADLLGRIQFIGALKDGSLKAKYTVPNSANVNKKKRRVPRFGTLEATLVTEDGDD